MERANRSSDFFDKVLSWLHLLLINRLVEPANFSRGKRKPKQEPKTDSLFRFTTTSRLNLKSAAKSAWARPIFHYITLTQSGSIYFNLLRLLVGSTTAVRRREQSFVQLYVHGC